MKAILGKKIGNSQIFQGDSIIGITLLEVGPCKVTQVKTKEKDGYDAVQLGFEDLGKNKIGKSQKGKEFRYLTEFRIQKSPGDATQYAQGTVIDASVLAEGDKVTISAISKGKGFQGAVRRYKVKARVASHGVKHEHRTIGSIGSSFPERVVPGKKMPGRMGGERVTVKNLKVVKIDKEHNLVALEGAVPGKNGTVVEISSQS